MKVVIKPALGEGVTPTDINNYIDMAPRGLKIRWESLREYISHRCMQFVHSVLQGGQQIPFTRYIYYPPPPKKK